MSNLSAFAYFKKKPFTANLSLAYGGLFSFVVVLSGIAGLGYQMAWSKMLAVALGHEIFAVLAVIAAFFVGLALGAFILNNAIARSTYPQRWYGICELIIALWSLLLVVIIPTFNAQIANMIGVQPSPLWHWFITFTATLILLLPATFCMGATLPAMEGVFKRIFNKRQKVPAIYALNTLGAVLGVILSTYWLVPAFGLRFTLLSFAGLNFLCGVSMLLIWRRKFAIVSTHSFLIQGNTEQKPKINELDHQNVNEHCVVIAPKPLLFTLFVCGWLGLGFEVLSIRALSQILENTVFTFAAVLCVYLLGTSIGAALYQVFYVNKWGANETLQKWRDTRFLMLIATALTCAIGALLLYLGGTIYSGVRALLGDGYLPAVVAEFTVATMVLLLPTLCMGLLFSHLIKPTVAMQKLGTGLGVNTLGSAIAPLTVGILLIPALGTKIGLVIVCIGYLLLIPFSGTVFVNKKPLVQRSKLAQLALIVAPCIALLLLALLPLPQGYLSTKQNRIVYFHEGSMAAVAVSQDNLGNKHLSVNNHYIMGGTASRFSDHRQTHLPFLLHGNPSKALYLGLGTGITMDAAQYYPNTQVTGVELIPELIPLLGEFDVQTQSSDWQTPPRLLSADARRFMLASKEQFDVIIAEIFHPSRDGAGALYTVEHYQQMRQKLAPNGLVCQWLPLFQLDLPTLQIIIKSFLKVFPKAQMHLGHFSLKQPILCLVGKNTETKFSENWLMNKVTHRPLQRELITSRLNSDLALLGGFIADHTVLRTFAGDAVLNTDNHPHVSYQAPAFVYDTHQLPSERLIQLLKVLGPARPEAITDSPTLAGELSQYWQARNLFLQAGLNVEPSDDATTILTKTYPLLISAVQTSQQFEPAYRALIGLALQMHKVDKQVAINILEALDEAAPIYLEARRLKNSIQ
jgi:spermidine synthase